MSNKRADLAKIHIAKKDLCLDDDTYRAILWTVCRVKSAADLDEYGRRKLLEHFRSRGWKPQRKPGPGKVARMNNALMGKVEAQLAELHAPWKYADAMAKRMFNVDSVRFCQPAQLRKIVAALTYEQKRRAKREVCPECGNTGGHAEGCPEVDNGSE